MRHDHAATLTDGARTRGRGPLSISRFLLGLRRNLADNLPRFAFWLAPGRTERLGGGRP